MLYGILERNKVHLSEISRSLKEDIPLKKTIEDFAQKFKGKYVINFKDRSGKNIQCKISCIPVRLCEFQDKELVLVAVYGFGNKPILLLSNLKMAEQKPLCNIVTNQHHNS